MEHLRKIRGGFAFPSEKALENYLCSGALETLLALRIVERQFRVDEEQICDIVAATPEGRPVIVELKNEVEKYVVPQLTRYYASFIERKPFVGKLDYTLPVRLIAVAPGFDRYNHIDRRFNTLSIEFHRHEIVEVDGEVLFRIVEIETGVEKSLRLRIAPQSHLDSGNREEIPGRLKRWLSGCPPAVEKAILKMRETLLATNGRIKEIAVGSNVFLYGISTGSPVAEIRYNAQRGEPVVFLRLRDSDFRSLLTNRKQKVGRMRLWFDDEDVTHIGYVPKNLGQMKTFAEWKQKLKLQFDWDPKDTRRQVDYRKPEGNTGYKELRATGGLKSHMPLAIRHYFAKSPEPRSGTVLPRLTQIALEQI